MNICMDYTEILPTGKENAVTTKELVKRLCFSSVRQLQADIARARVEGQIICSKQTEGGGYYLPKDQAELREFLNSMEGRAANIYMAIKAAREALELPQDQLSLFEDNKE